MGTKYTTTSSSGYNASPPADDGSQVASNEIRWSYIKEKLSDVLKTFIEAIDSKLVTHFDEKVIDKAANFTTTTAEHKQTVNATAAITVSLGDATTMAVGYIVTVKNSHTAAITVDLATGTDTLDGTAAGSISLAPDAAATFITTTGANGYLIKSVQVGDDLTIANDLTVSNDLAVTGATTFTGTTTHTDELILNAGYSEDADEYTATTGTRDLDVSVATYFYPSADMGTASITFTFSNPATSGRVSSFVLEMLGADGATITWPASVEWANADTEPTWTAGTDVVSFITRDGGTTWRGFAGGLNF